ncbi:hypothetical protein MVEN_00755000 [Mycena venus]|uniref:DUF7729 domain-containing protein n=1 Tax=Mycena venus TaxID=2733690 RepID=A0A8H6YL34_9AGAR|nr:hypothetical protein MVEN_00755000 [Mycena venus]
MFTPPPSPGRPPSNLKDGILVPDAPVSGAAAHPMSPETLKRRIGRRTRWTVVLVPIALVLITVSTRYLTHPAAFDLFSEPPSLNWESLSERASGLDAAQATSSSRTTGRFGVDVTVPVVFACIPHGISILRWSGVDQCAHFSTNCPDHPRFTPDASDTVPPTIRLGFKPKISRASEAFIEAQNNLTLLNDIVWGTCNTTIDDAGCSANIDWFSKNLASSCAIDLKDGNAMALNTQIALNAFDLMRNAGCLTDPTTNTYCYLDAVRNSNPSDTYFYSLPPWYRHAEQHNRVVLGMHQESYDALLRGQVYPGAAKIAVADCGTAYATLATGKPSGALRTVPGLLTGILLALAVTLLSVT